VLFDGKMYFLEEFGGAEVGSGGTLSAAICALEGRSNALSPLPFSERFGLGRRSSALHRECGAAVDAESAHSLSFSLSASSALRRDVLLRAEPAEWLCFRRPVTLSIPRRMDRVTPSNDGLLPVPAALPKAQRRSFFFGRIYRTNCNRTSYRWPKSNTDRGATAKVHGNSTSNRKLSSLWHAVHDAI